MIAKVIEINIMIEKENSKIKVCDCTIGNNNIYRRKRFN